MAVAGKSLPQAELTQSGRPILHRNEIEVFYLSKIDLTSDATETLILKSPTLILTTHRLLFLPETTTASGVTAATIPLSSIVHIFPAKKSIKSMFASPRVRFQVSGLWDGASVVVTVVVRGKCDVDAFVEKLWGNWRGRAWENDVASENVVLGSSSGEKGFDSSGMRVVGVAGILRREQEIWETTDKSLQDAFQDLNALMGKAKEMVLLAEKMRQKLLSGTSSHGSTSNDEEMGSKEEMQDWLLSVGIVSPVTKESAGALYHQQLSRQLADFVRIPLDRAGGMINLIDIYCLFNRARGTELISPEDLLQACAIWEKIDAPVMLRKFDSGVKVIQSKSHSDEEVFARIRNLALKPETLQTGISASDAAMTLGIAPAMAKEQLLSAESKGLLCRDISPDGFRFFINVFPDISPDDMYIVQDRGVYTTWIEAVAV